MNYITHLNYWFDTLEQDQNVKPNHISLYLALFHIWNQHRFSEAFFVNRTDLMSLSKIGSKTTYCKCMTDLHQWGWIRYFPSHSIYSRSKVNMYDWSKNETTSKPSQPTKKETSPHTSSEPLVGHNIQTSKKETKTILKDKLNSNFKSNYHEPL